MQNNELQHLIWAIENIVDAAHKKSNLIRQSSDPDKELKLIKIVDILQDATKKSSQLQSTSIDGIAIGTFFYITAIKNV